MFNKERKRKINRWRKKKKNVSISKEQKSEWGSEAIDPSEEISNFGEKEDQKWPELNPLWASWITYTTQVYRVGNTCRRVFHGDSCPAKLDRSENPPVLWVLRFRYSERWGEKDIFICEQNIEQRGRFNLIPEIYCHLGWRSSLVSNYKITFLLSFRIFLKS